MNGKIDLLSAERDLALSLCAADDARGAIGAGVASFEAILPDWGICIHAADGNAPFQGSAGGLAETARRIAEGNQEGGEGNRSLQVVRRDQGDGLSLRLTAISSEAERPGEDVARYLAGMGSALEATLRRIGRTRLLADSLRDRELLIREARHRVRNSLQYFFNTIPLFMPPETVLPPAELELMERRIAAFISIHDLLGGAVGGGTVSAEGYFLKLAEALRTLVLDASGSFVARWEASRSPILTADRATTIGLIVHELVMNSMKHARGKRVRMDLSAGLQEDELEVRYFDEEENGDEEPGVEAGRMETAGPPSDCIGREGSGTGIMKDLLARAGGRRTDGGSSPHAFAARFPVVGRG